MTRLNPEDRKAQILKAAMTCAEDSTYQRVTREAVAVVAGVSPSLISMHFGSAEDFRRAIIGEAIRTKHLKIIAQAIAADHPRARKAPPELRAEALATLAA